MKEYVYDFAAALGDTVKEKYESLHKLLLEIHGERPIRMAVGSREVTSLFEVSCGVMEATPIIATLGDMSYAGKVNCHQLHFQVFHSTRLAVDELVLFGENGNSVVRFRYFVDLDRREQS